jgi:hypothetical protein
VGAAVGAIEGSVPGLVVPVQDAPSNSHPATTSIVTRFTTGVRPAGRSASITTAGSARRPSETEYDSDPGPAHLYRLRPTGHELVAAFRDALEQISAATATGSEHPPNPRRR